MVSSEWREKKKKKKENSIKRRLTSASSKLLQCWSHYGWEGPLTSSSPTVHLSAASLTEPRPSVPHLHVCEHLQAQ